jgi:Tfp pilus assembly protein PilN
MININVYQDFNGEQSVQDKPYFLIILVVLAVLAYSGPYFFSTHITVEAKDIQIKNLEKNKELEKLKEKKKEIQRLKELLADIQSRSQQIEALKGGRKHMVHTLDKLQSLHIKKIWLTKVKLSPTKMSLQGYAWDDYLISEYIAKLRTNRPEATSLITLVKDFEPEVFDMDAEEQTNEIENSEEDQETKVKVTQDEKTTEKNKTVDEGTQKEVAQTPTTVPKDSSTKDPKNIPEDKEEVPLEEPIAMNFPTSFKNIQLKKSITELVDNYPYRRFEIELDVQGML